MAGPSHKKQTTEQHKLDTTNIFLDLIKHNIGILSGHLANFAPELSRLAEPIVNATIALHAEVADPLCPPSYPTAAPPPSYVSPH